jgi:hypothetical protein
MNIKRVIFSALTTIISTNISIALTIDCFPAKVGNYWIYKQDFRIEVTDTANDTNWAELFTDSFLCKFGDIDTMEEWETYRYDLGPFTGDSFPEKRWFAHHDTAFLWIAYSGFYSVSPPWKDKKEVGFVFNGKYFTSSRKLQYYINQVKNGRLGSTQTADTTYWIPPKKVLVFPLTIGTRWISMEFPWLEERKVIAEEVIEVSAGTFSTLKIEFYPDLPEIWIFHWIAEQGIVKDSTYSWGIATDSMGNTIGWWDSYDVYTLMDYHVEGIEETENTQQVIKKLWVSPNPFIDRAVINLSNQHTTNAYITDLTGRTVERVNDNIIGKNFVPGIYFLKAKGCKPIKIVKLK